MLAARFRIPRVLTCLAASLALGACGDRGQDQTVGQQVDKAIDRAGEAGRDLRRGAEDAAQDARSATMGAASQAASGTGARSDDAKITSQVQDAFKADKDLGGGGIDVTAREGVVTLKGTAPSAAAKARAAEIARNVKDVKSVDNQLSVRGG